MFFLLTLSAAISLAFGNILQSVGLRSVSFATFLFKNKFWLCGVFLTIVGSVLYYASVAEYDISLVQPYMALNPALTAILGWKFLNEKMSKKIAFAISLVFCGLVIDGILAGENMSAANYGGTLWIYAGASLALLALLCIFFRKAEIMASLCAGVGFGLCAVIFKSISLDGLSSLPVDLRIFVLVPLYLASFVCLQAGLRKGRALFVVPLSAAVGLIVPVLGGVMVFAEPFPPQKIAMLLLVFAGMVLFVRE